MIKLFVKETKDLITQENMKRIQKEFQNQLILRGQWTYFDLDLKVGANQTYPHQLMFVPRDLLQTWISGSGTLTWHYDLFTKDFINFTVATAPVTVRFFLGAFVKGDVSV